MGAHTSSLALWPWVQVLTRSGLELTALAAHCGLDQGELRDPAARIPQAAANRMAELAFARVGPGAAILAAQSVEAGHFQLVEQAVRAAATVADGLDVMTELFPLVHAGGRLQHGRTRDASIVRYADGGGSPVHPGYVELLFATGLCAVRRETGKRVVPLRVTFSHPPLGGSPLHAKLFGPDVRFGMRTNSMSFSAESAELPLLRADPAVLARATRAAGELHREVVAGDEPEPPAQTPAPAYAKAR